MLFDSAFENNIFVHSKCIVSNVRLNLFWSKLFKANLLCVRNFINKMSFMNCLQCVNSYSSYLQISFLEIWPCIVSSDTDLASSCTIHFRTQKYACFDSVKIHCHTVCECSLRCELYVYAMN